MQKIVTIEKENETAHACRHVLRMTAAGMAGILCLGNAVLPVSAFIKGSAGPDRAGMQIGPVRSEEDAENERESTDPGKAGEEEVFRNWHLDPDAFPSEANGEIPEVPEDLLPFFEEMTQEAVLWYAGQAPATADLSPYSPRADAIRAAVRDAAGRTAERDKKDILKKLQAAASVWDGSALERMLASLQSSGTIEASASGGRPGPDGFPAVSAHAMERGPEGEEPEEREGTSFHPGLPSLQTYLRERKDTAAGDSEASVPEGSSTGAAGSGEGSAAGSGEEYVTDPGDDTAADLWAASAQRGTGPLPVPPGLYDFTIRFPASAEKMQTPGGRTLFPGLSHYIGFTDPDHQTALGEHSADIKNKNREEMQTALLPDAVPFSQSKSFSEEDSSGSVADPGAVYALSGAAPLAQTSVPSQRRTIFIGDSRTVGMQMYVGGEENEYWSAKNSMGYSWMRESGVPAVEDLIGRDTDVVILMGVNDLGNMGSYVDYMNEKAAERKRRGARTFFVSVTPVRENGSHNARNSRIDEFNAYAQANLRGVHYIDAADRIRDSFGSPDGLHYDGPTYREIYRIIRFYVYRGWYERDGLRFWFDCGRPVTGWQFLEGQWQYMDGLGVRWVTNGRVGDVCLAPYPETEMLDPYKAVLVPGDL